MRWGKGEGIRSQEGSHVLVRKLTALKKVIGGRTNKREMGRGEGVRKCNVATANTTEKQTTFGDTNNK